MGLFYVSGRLTGPTGRTETLDLLVDTGATLLVVTRLLADRLELRTQRTQAVQIARGGDEVWSISEVRLKIDGQEVTTPCFTAPGGSALLGAVALESLFLAVDPVAQKLVPVKGSLADEARWGDAMMIDIVEARALSPYRVWVRFEDNVQGEIDLSELIRFEGVFAALRDPARFAEVSVDPELGSLHWPNGADLDPDVLYAKITAQGIEI